METPSYNWVCQVCDSSNIAGEGKCHHCNSPSYLSADQIKLRKSGEYIETIASEKPVGAKIAASLLLIFPIYYIVNAAIFERDLALFWGSLLVSVFFVTFAYGIYFANRWLVGIYTFLVIVSIIAGVLWQAWSILFNFEMLIHIIVVCILFSKDMKKWLIG